MALARDSNSFFLLMLLSTWISNYDVVILYRCLAYPSNLQSYTVGNESAVDVVFSGRGHICVSKPGKTGLV